MNPKKNKWVWHSARFKGTFKREDFGNGVVIVWPLPRALSDAADGQCEFFPLPTSVASPKWWVYQQKVTVSVRTNTERPILITAIHGSLLSKAQSVCLVGPIPKPSRRKLRWGDGPHVKEIKKKLVRSLKSTNECSELRILCVHLMFSYHEVGDKKRDFGNLTGMGQDSGDPPSPRQVSLPLSPPAHMNEVCSWKNLPRRVFRRAVWQSFRSTTGSSI